jgi:hypothetical protein
MAWRKTTGSPDGRNAGVEARAVLAERWRAAHEQFSESTKAAGFGRGHWQAKVEALERGEPVVVASWEIPRLFPGIRAYPHRYFKLHADGTLEETDPRAGT